MPIKTIRVDLENCYGIKDLKQDFDFSEHNVYALYAPNGAMKTSFAEAFRNLSDGVESTDRIFPDRVTKRSIVDDTGTELPPERVLVVSPYDETLGLTERTSTLLVDSRLKREYEALHVEVDRAKKALLRALKKQSQSKKDLEREISAAFTSQDDQFYRALIRIKDELGSQQDAPFADFLYDTVFDDKVLAFLDTKDFKAAIQGYVEQYNELLDGSTYFNRRTFNYYNAAQIAKSLTANGFFDAKHSVNLNADERLEITSPQELEQLISKEEARITNDVALRRKFADIKKQLEKNVTLREFQSYLQGLPGLLPRLANINSLREDIWKSYLKAHASLYEDVISKHQNNEKRKKQIEDEARKQRTQWEGVIDIFNDRFFVPFRLAPKNREAVILGDDSMLSLEFVFHEDDGGQDARVDRDTLMQALSTGEKKALYVLNIIFEVEARRKAQQETLFIVDDIADSFDYRNKYAIIQYLMDIAEGPLFKQILLTHNFDFFRTVNSRFVAYGQCLMAAKTSNGLSIKQAEGIKNPFVNAWKRGFFTDPKKRVASIPFLRNLIEYTRGIVDDDFGKLTALLHWKATSRTISQADLDAIYNKLFDEKGESTWGKTAVVEMIAETADACMNGGDGADAIRFESKIVLSIAIRVTAERFMAEKINDSAFLNGIESNQSHKLLKRFEKEFGAETEALDVLKRVVLMTPENIHLNSFMYEPILDMSDEHLKKLYGEVSALKA